MKECPKCRAENLDSAKFCSECGALLTQSDVRENKQPEGSADATEAGAAFGSEQQSKSEVISRKMFRFSSSSEKFLASIGNNFIENFLMGGRVEQTFAALTDKRLYYHGHTLTGNGLKQSKTTEEGSVMVKDITYTGFTHNDPKWMKYVGLILIASGLIDLFSIFGSISYNGIAQDMVIPATLCFICPVALGVLLLRNYKLNKISVFLVRFAGGGLAFKVNYYPEEESKRFQDALNRAIDDQK